MSDQNQDPKPNQNSKPNQAQNVNPDRESNLNQAQNVNPDRESNLNQDRNLNQDPNLHWVFDEEPVRPNPIKPAPANSIKPASANPMEPVRPAPTESGSADENVTLISTPARQPYIRKAVTSSGVDRFPASDRPETADAPGGSAQSPASGRDSQAAETGKSRGSQAADVGKSRDSQAADAGKSRGSRAEDAGQSRDSQAADAGQSRGSQAADAGKGKGSRLRKIRLNQDFRGRSLTGEREELEEELSDEDLDRAQMKWALASKLRVYGLVTVIVLAVVFIVFLFGNFFRYTGYSSLASVPQASTASTNYTSVDDAVLTFDGEGATLLNLDLTQIWNVQYTISSPAVSTSGDAIAIYDKQGSTIVLCDQSGERASITTSYPLIKAKVSGLGSVAAIEKDGEVTWIEYFNPDGSRVASVRTSMDSTGYPLDMAVSDDGMVLAVSYIAYDGEEQKGLLDFYQFGSTGQNQIDNRVAEFEYKDHFFPQVEFLGDNRCVAFRDNGFSIFTANDVPAKITDTVLEDKISSVAYDDSKIAILTPSTGRDGEAETLVTLYNLDGDKVRAFDTDISYNTVELKGGELDFYADNNLAVYSTGGVRKYDGTIEEDAGSIFSVGNFRFGVVTDDSLNIIKLH